MKIHEILTELRRNPEQNPKVSINQHIADAYQQVTETGSKIAGVYNKFVSFTSVEKLGINPNSSIINATGIYAYPIEYAYAKMKSGRSAHDALPIAGTSAHANIFSVQGNIINLGKLTKPEFNEYCQKLIEIYPQYMGDSQESTDELLDRIKEIQNYGRKPGSHLWYLLSIVSGMIHKQRTGKRPNSTTGANSDLWNALWRRLGVNGVIDNGYGIIHDTTHTQAVFFSTEAIVNNVSVYNKYSPKQMDAAIEYGKVAPQQKINAKNKAMKKAKQIKDMQEKINSLPEDKQCKAINRFGGSFIQYIDNPSLLVQQTAIPRGYANKIYSFIKHPSEEINLFLVTHEPWNAWRNIAYIANPSEQVQLAAIDNNKEAIELIKNPTPKAIALAKSK